MDFDSALASLRSSCGRPPASALRAVAERPGELAGAVLVVLELGAAGELLTAEEENLLFSGLYVLAEGRRCEVLPVLCRFLRASPVTVEGVFDEDFMHLSGILYSLGGEGAGPLLELGGDVGTHDDVRGAAIAALGRLVAEGRADRARVVQLLDAFDREADSPVGEWAYHSWAEAILALQLRDFVPRVRAAYEAGRVPFADEDWEEWLADLDDPKPSLLVTPIDNAQAALACFSDAGPVEAGEVAPGRLAWLDRVLWQSFESTAIGQCMPLEMVDGFFTGVLCGPEPRPGFDHALQELLPKLEDAFKRPEVGWEVRESLREIFEALEWRLSEGIPPDPWITDTPVVPRGELWATGFARAVGVNMAAWAPLLRNRAMRPVVAGLVYPAAQRGREGDLLRDDLCDAAGELALEVRSFWRNGPSARALRSLDVGRNEPCPCGSGKKFKKCCGAPESRQAQPVH